MTDWHRITRADDGRYELDGVPLAPCTPILFRREGFAPIEMFLTCSRAPSRQPHVITTGIKSDPDGNGLGFVALVAELDDDELRRLHVAFSSPAERSRQLRLAKGAA